MPDFIVLVQQQYCFVKGVESTPVIENQEKPGLNGVKRVRSFL